MKTIDVARLAQIVSRPMTATEAAAAFLLAAHEAGVNIAEADPPSAAPVSSPSETA